MDYGSPTEEHLNTRTSVSIFDVSHMGRYVIKGKDSFKLLQKLVTKDLSEVKEGFMSGPVLLLNEKAGIKDDIMLYKLKDDSWLAVVNAPNVVSDREWMLRWKSEWGLNDVDIEDVTLKTALLAIQGPKAPEVMEGLGLHDAKKLKILEFMYKVELLGKEAFLVSHSGWTGEEVRSYGFEVWTDVSHGKEIFEKAIELGAKPAGLIARDSLRLEMGYLLIGQDMDETVNPIEARYWLPLSLDKGECLGCPKLLEIYEKGVSKVRVGFKLKKGVKSIPRHGYKIYAGREEVGYVTSGAYSSFTGRSIGMGYVRTDHPYIGFKLDLDVRGVKQEIKISEFPLI